MSPKRTQDVREERSRAHKIYKIAQFRFNQISTSAKHANIQAGSDDKNKLITDLHLFKELRALAALEIRLRKEFNRKYYNDAHKGIQEQVRQREALLPGLQHEITALKQDLGYYQQGPLDAPGGLARHPNDPTDVEEEAAILHFLESCADSIPYDPESRWETARNEFVENDLDRSQNLSPQVSRTASDLLDDEEFAEITSNLYDPKFNDSDISLSQEEVDPDRTSQGSRQAYLAEQREQEETLEQEDQDNSQGSVKESTVSEPRKVRYTDATWLSDADLQWLRSGARGKRPKRRENPEKPS